jgi:hypothetical protein
MLPHTKCIHGAQSPRCQYIDPRLVNKPCMRCSVFWGVTQHRQTYWSCLQRSGSPRTAWPLKMELIVCPKMLVPNFQSKLRKITEEQRFHLCCGRSLKSHNSLQFIHPNISFMLLQKPEITQVPTFYRPHQFITMLTRTHHLHQYWAKLIQSNALPVCFISFIHAYPPKFCGYLFSFTHVK